MKKIKTGLKIAYARKMKGLEQRALAEMTGISDKKLSSIETGRTRISIEDLKTVSQVLDYPIDFFIRDEEGPYEVVDHKDAHPEEFIKIPLLGDVHAGRLAEAIENPPEHIVAPTGVRADMALRIKGDCMAPEIEHGDIIFVRRQPVAENGQRVIALCEEEYCVRRYYRYDGVTVLRPDNPKYPEIAGRNIEIAGIITWVLKKIV